MGSSLNSPCDTNHAIPVTCNAIWDVPSLVHCLGQIYFKAFLGLEAMCVCGDVVCGGAMGRLLGFHSLACERGTPSLFPHQRISNTA